MGSIHSSVLALVAEKLDGVGFNYAFLGGSITALLLDNPDLSVPRPTDDVDVIVEVLAGRRYSDMEAALRRAGFDHDTREGAPLCRWVWQGLTIDIMPTEGSMLGINTRWFPEALASATTRLIGNKQLRIVSPVAFLVTKLVAFADRGAGDFYRSHDLEDLVTVIDGRAAIVEEVEAAPTELKNYVVSTLRSLQRDSRFQEALPAHLDSDEATQQRLPGLRRKISAIAALLA